MVVVVIKIKKLIKINITRRNSNIYFSITHQDISIYKRGVGFICNIGGVEVHSRNLPEIVATTSTLHKVYLRGCAHEYDKRETAVYDPDRLIEKQLKEVARELNSSMRMFCGEVMNEVNRV